MRHSEVKQIWHGRTVSKWQRMEIWILLSDSKPLSFLLGSGKTLFPILLHHQLKKGKVRSNVPHLELIMISKCRASYLVWILNYFDILCTKFFTIKFNKSQENLWEADELWLFIDVLLSVLFFKKDYYRIKHRIFYKHYEQMQYLENIY